jgi:two-component system, LuxR family, sensor kinase FixL
LRVSSETGHWRALADASPEAEAQGLVAPLHRVLAGGEPWIGSDVEFTVRNGCDGSPERRYVDFIWQATRDDTDSVTGLICFGYDVTGRQLARERADRLRAQLLHASRLNAMGTMAMTLAHELNQPLTAAANFLTAGQRFLSLGREQDEVEDLLRESERQIQRAGEIIRRMRALVSAGAAHRERVPLAAVVQRAVLLIEANCELNGQTIRTDIGDGAETVLADRVQLEQILLNLLRNAIHASAPGSPSVAIDATLSGAMVQLSVRDRGTGIAPDRIAGLFDALQPSTSGGLGVGLSLCRTMVEAQRGRIWAEAPPDGGTIVHFTLPADAPQPGRVAPE